MSPDDQQLESEQDGPAELLAVLAYMLRKLTGTSTPHESARERKKRFPGR